VLVGTGYDKKHFIDLYDKKYNLTYGMGELKDTPASFIFDDRTNNAALYFRDYKPYSGYIVHELFHLIYFISQRYSMPICDQTEEFYALLSDNLFNQIYREIYTTKKEVR
jgi:hypothetical protein